MAARHQLFDIEESALPQVRTWLKASLGPVAARPEGYQFIQAVDELCSNIVEHAEEKAFSKANSFSIQLMTQPNRVEAAITYSGDDFDLTSYQPRTIDDLFRQGHKGGLGIRLIHTLANHVDYKREGSVNVCTIAKLIN